MAVNSDGRPWFVYTLKDPRDLAIRYVGWTWDPTYRLRRHVCDAKREQCHKSRWIRSLLALGLAPTIHVIARGVGDGWAAAERKWIARLRDLGARLTNATDGGEGTPGMSPSAATREKQAAAKRGRKLPPAHVAALTAASRRTNADPDVRRRIAAALRGRPRPPEVIAKIRATKARKRAAYTLPAEADDRWQ